MVLQVHVFILFVDTREYVKYIRTRSNICYVVKKEKKKILQSEVA